MFSLLFGCLLFAGFNVSAQKSEKYYESMEKYRKAMDLFEKEKFGSAQNAFEHIVHAESDVHSELASNASYYRALCGLMLFNTNAENLLIEFITNYPESPKVNRAYFDLGLYQYRKRRFQRAASWFEKVDVYVLGNEEIAEYYFKLGYSYFKEENREAALRALFEIKDAQTKYSIVSKYYYAHLSYETGNLKAALTYFREIEKDPTFASVIPYYITQILYLQEKDEELIEYAKVVLDSVSAQRAAEISKLIGNALYRLKRFDEAIPYLEKFASESPVAKFEDFYQVGDALASIQKYEEAVQWFQKALSPDDSLNQIIQYNMAEAYLKIGNKRLARAAMREAYQFGMDEEIKENALYGYAKLSYELSKFPYNDAIRAFEEYLNKYPNSKHLEEANEYLVDVYFTTKSYEEARKSLDRIKNRGYKLNLAYQKILYLLGIENMNKGLYEPAIAYLDLAIQENYNRAVKIDAFFWKAECFFRLLKYDLSIQFFEAFLFEPGAISSPYYNLAQYNLGYAFYRKREYGKAMFRFRQFVDNAQNVDQKLKNDALLRVADSYFVTKDYKNAAEFYNKAATMGLFEKDYAIFQSALANGVLGNYKEKVEKLNVLANDFHSSLYYDDALYELGGIYFTQGDEAKASVLFEQLIDEKPESPYFGRAMLKTGLIYFNAKKDTLALDKFQVVVQQYKNSSEAKEAIQKIKQIYISRGDLNGFELYMANIGIHDIPATSLDSAAYEIAENAYLNNKCDEAVKNFTVYIERYADGLFLLNAHYYRGECELRSAFDEEALIDFEYVINHQKNIFTEKALLHAANLSRKAGKDDKAIAYYSDLEKKSDLASNRDLAEYRLMQLYFKTGQEKLALSYGERIRQKPNLLSEVKNEILRLSGKVYLKNDRYNKAYSAFKELSQSNTEGGAEGKYQLAYIEFMRGNLDSSEHYIDEVLNQVPAYDYWIAKAFILWSDLYLSRGDQYQAKLSLQTVIDNVEIAELKAKAKEKLLLLEKLIQAEKEKNQKVEETMEIDFSGDEDYDFLFEEEEIVEELPTPQKATEEPVLPPVEEEPKTAEELESDTLDALQNSAEPETPENPESEVMENEKIEVDTIPEERSPDAVESPEEVVPKEVEVLETEQMEEEGEPKVMETVQPKSDEEGAEVKMEIEKNTEEPKEVEEEVLEGIENEEIPK